MKHINVSVFLVALATLISELSLVRVFDALFYPGIANMIISSALFGLGLAGIYVSLRPISKAENIRNTLSTYAASCAVAIFIVRPVMNILPFNFNVLFQQPTVQLIYFSLMYLSLLLPFFLAGLILTTIYTNFADKIRSLYFWDLLGAAVGSAVLVPFIPIIGPGGLLFCASAFILIASSLLSTKKVWVLLSALIAVALVIIPFVRSPQYYDFSDHQGKRGVQWAREQGRVLETIWDPISRLDIVKFSESSDRLEIMYDGGSQQTSLIPFDGDFERLETNLPNELQKHFWNKGVLASHYLLRNTNQSVLVIGSAGGQEVKAALLYGAQRVNGIELVGAVVELGKGKYASLIGDLFHHPYVDIQVGEGRSFLRASTTKYDIIQIYSNHTSSSIAAGGEAIAPVYLQTVEAYQEYFEHLTEKGILHINHHNYPRMITTAAQAWSEMGRTDFQSHVLVFERPGGDTIPTLLIKNQPWSENEVAELETFFYAQFEGDKNTYRLVENPIDPEQSVLTPDYYSGQLTSEFVNSSKFRIYPATDNLPYFNFYPNSIFQAILDLPSQIRLDNGNIDLTVAPIAITGLVSLFYSAIFTLVPLIFSEAGRSKWAGKGYTLLYFSCLGAGFIIIELVLIQIFLRLIGSPLHTYTAVIASILVGAGIGSAVSGRLGITMKRRWYWPFLGILLTVLSLISTFPLSSQALLASPLLNRIVMSVVLLLPVGLFLGMPFPLGIFAIRELPRGVIPWVWGVNGLFTVIGSLGSLLISVQWGLMASLLFGLALYAVALIIFSRLRMILQ